MNEYITKEELEAPRKASEILDWHRAKRQEIGNSRAGISASRATEGMLEDFFHEALPIAVFADDYFQRSEQVTICHVIGGQKYDARIIDLRIEKSDLQYLEVTLASEGFHDHLRMLELDQKGSVNSYGSVKVSGTKRMGREVEIGNDCLPLHEVIQREHNYILEAAKRKSKKVYPEGTGIIIYCEDSRSFDNDQIDETNRFFEDDVVPLLGQFDGVFLVGKSKGLLLLHTKLNTTG